jgi:hypothetical protein
MEQISNKRFFYVNTENTLSASNSVYSTPLQIPDYAKYDRVVLLEASIPITYYLIQGNGFNTFQLKEDSTTVTVTIEPGNYNINSFATIVGGLMTSLSPNNLTYTFSYNNSYTQAQNGLYTITANSSAHSISLIFNPGNTVNEQFGFNSGTTVSFTNSVGTSILTSTNVLQFVPENIVAIHSNIVDGGYTDILEIVTNQNNPPYSYINYQCPDPASYSRILSTNKSQNVTFAFTNEHEQALFFNGVNISLTLMLYKANDYYAKSEAYIKYKAIENSNIS